MTQRSITLVTGANGNLGGAVVQHLQRDGLLVGKIERGQLLVDDVAVSGVDLADGASVRRAFGVLASEGFALRALVHTVGVFRSSGPLIDTPDGDFVELFRTNVLTTVHVIQAALVSMQPLSQGRIAVVASTDALAGRARLAAYGASKAAQLRVVESVARELEGTGITINAVLPGTMDTPQNRAAMPDADPKRWIDLAEVASVLAFLVSDAASGIHGQALRLERGRS